MHPSEKRFSQASVLGPCHLDLGGAVMKRWFLSAAVLLLTFVCFANQHALAQFADRAIITGVVTDASGAAIPDARVTITDEQTGVKTIVGTNSAGNYSTPPLILGTYRVDIQKQGFKVFSRTGYSLTGGQTVRVDEALGVGSYTASVRVGAMTNEFMFSDEDTEQITIGVSN